MQLHTIDPLRDPRWGEFLQRHPRASVFHSRGWLEALRRTYGYSPVAYTTAPPGQELKDGLIFCLVNSRLTGRRLVSLPFSDHCEPLVDSAEKLRALLAFLQQESRRKHWKYIEFRPFSADLAGNEGYESSERYYLHAVNLSPSLEELFGRLQKDSVQRKIRRAEREGLQYKVGRSPELRRKFYQLLLMTRRRHQLPPQPEEWFSNLLECMGDAAQIRIASKSSTPIAAILTLHFRETIIYKYGCSDPAFHNLGGIPFLFWETIQEAKASGVFEYDLGRSDLDNDGLIAFKDHWASKRRILTYWRHPAKALTPISEGWTMQLVKRVFAHMPDRFLIATGKLLYRHIG